MSRMMADHPNLVSWAILAAGMLAILSWSARDVGLAPSQWFWLGVATVLLAGLCTWIISWEADEDSVDEDDDGDEAAEQVGDDGETVPAAEPIAAAEEPIAADESTRSPDPDSGPASSPPKGDEAEK